MAKIRIDNVHAQILESLTQASQGGQVAPIRPGVSPVVGALNAAQDLVGLVDGAAALDAAQAQLGAPRLSGAVLGVVSDPAALIAQMNPELIAPGADLARVLAQETQHHLELLGLGRLGAGDKVLFVNEMGLRTAAQASRFPAAVLGRQLLETAQGDPFFLNQAGGQALQRAFNAAAKVELGQSFADALSGSPPSALARDVLGRLGPRYFNDFDPRTLRAMPGRLLAPYGEQLLGAVNAMDPRVIGQRLLGDVTSGLRREIGQSLLSAAPASLQGDVGKLLLDSVGKNPLALGESLLRSVGKKQLASLGGELFKSVPGLAQLGPQGLADKLAGALFQKGNVGKNLLGALKDYGVGKLKDLGKGILEKLGKPLLDGVKDKVIGWVKDSALGKLGQGLLDKIGGGILDKLGGVGKIASGALSLLNGKLDVKQLLKIGMNFIPVVGPVLGLLSSIPGVGKIFDKVLGGIAKVLMKIPGVSHLLKGITKVANWVGKGVGKVVGWVKDGIGKVAGWVGKGLKKVGGWIGDGVKKVGKAIGKGVKKVGEAIGDGVKKVGKAVGNVAKKAWKAVKKY